MANRDLWKKTNKLNHERKTKAIIEFYEALRNKRYEGIRVYTNQYCLKKTAEEFYLSVRSIEAKVYSSNNE